MHGRENQKLIQPVIFRKRRGRRAGRKQGIPTEPSESELKLNPWAVRETGVHTDAPIGTAALLELPTGSAEQNRPLFIKTEAPFPFTGESVGFF